MQFIKRKNKKEVKVEKKVEVKVEKKVEVKKEKKKEKKSTRVKADGRKIGTTVVSRVYNKTMNGTDYKVVETVDGLTYTLSQEDFNNQVSE